MTILSTLSKVATVVPKPPLSLLRLAGAVTPVGAGLVVGSVVAVKAFEHKEEIKSTLGSIVHNAQNVASAGKSTIESKLETKKPSEEPSMLIPMLLVGGGLVVLFIVLRK